MGPLPELLPNIFRRLTLIFPGHVFAPLTKGLSLFVLREHESCESGNLEKHWQVEAPNSSPHLNTRHPNDITICSDPSSAPNMEGEQGLNLGLKTPKQRSLPFLPSTRKWAVCVQQACFMTVEQAWHGRFVVQYYHPCAFTKP